MNQSQNNKFRTLDDVNNAELSELFHHSDESLDQSVQNILTAQCRLGPAVGGALLRSHGENAIDILAVHPRLETNVSIPEWLTNSMVFVREALLSHVTVLRPLGEFSRYCYQPVKHYILVVPLRDIDLGEILAVFLVETDHEEVLEITTNRLKLLASMLSRAKAMPTQNSRQESNVQLYQALEILSCVNIQERFTSAAMAFCNEVASQWKCERVSIGFLKERYVQLKAMSHTESFSRKMQVVQDIEAAMEECLDQDVEILSPAPKEAAYVSRAADKLSERYGPLNILSFPLRRNEEALAVLTLERPVDKTLSPDEIETIRLACELCTPGLVNLYEYGRWIGATLAIKTRNSLAGLVGPKHTWIKLIAILCFAAMLFLIFAKGQFRPDAPFVLEATYQQVVPAPFDGYIKHVDVEVGDVVEGGSSVLGGLDTAELRLSLAAAKAEKASYLKQASAAMRDGETAQAQIAQANADKIQAQIELLEYQIGQASLVSPISGVVIKGDLKRQIGAPVQVGDVLFEVCPLESLRAQLMVPEDMIYDIKVGQEGYLATASYPGQRIKFVVERINPIAEVVNQRNVFKVRVQLLETHSWMRPGMEGIAKVSVGKRRYVWIWTRKIVNWIRMKLWL